MNKRVNLKPPITFVFVQREFSGEYSGNAGPHIPNQHLPIAAAWLASGDMPQKLCHSKMG
jgi:hypothetical protein